MHHKAFRALSMVLLAALPLLSHSTAAGTPVGTVCFSQIAEPCSEQGPIFTGGVGSRLRLSVFVAGSDSFGRFEVLVSTDPSVLSPRSADTTGDVFASEGFPVGTLLCINGSGTNCGPQDGPGVVHLVAWGYYATTAPTVGILFSINYTVTGTANGSSIFFAKGCTNTSVADGTCVTLNSPPIQVAVQAASFSNIAPTAGDFNILATPSSLSSPRGLLSTSKITFTSLENFNATLTTSVTTSSPYLTGWLRTPVVTLIANILATNLTVFSLTQIFPGTYSVNVTATAGRLSHSAMLQVTVLQDQAINEVQNSDFRDGLFDWTTNIVASRTVPGSCLDCFKTYPVFHVVANAGPCPTGKQGTSAIEIQNTLSSSGYVEQSFAIPAAGADLALVSWGEPIEVSMVDRGIVAQNGTVVNGTGSIYFPGPFATSRTVNTGPCAGYTLMTAYDLSRFAGRMVSLRVGAVYYGYDVGSSCFSDIQVVPVGNAAIRDFNITVNPVSISVPRTQNGTVKVTINSLNGLATSVNLNVTMIPPLPTYAISGASPTLVFSQNSVSLQPGHFAVITLTVFAPKGTPAFSYDLKITAYSNRSRTYQDVSLSIPGIALLLSIQNPASAHLGESVSIVDKFFNVGDLPVRITSAVVSTSFGTFTLLNPNPCLSQQYAQICCYNLCDIPGALMIAPGDNLTFLAKITVPLSAQQGNYSLVENVQWQYLTSFPKIWYDAGPSAVQSRIFILNTGGPTPSPNPITSHSRPASYLVTLLGFFEQALPIAGIMAALIAVIAVLLLRRRTSKAT